MPYPEALVAPMRAELVQLGVQELRDAAQVDTFFADAEGKTDLLVVNSVCGCAAAMARPGVAMALQTGQGPDRSATVFAGQDLEATGRAREYMMGIPPSSPFIAVLRDGDPVYVLERRHIEGRTAAAIATDLVQAFQRHCGSDAPPADGLEQPETPAQGALPPTFRSIL